MNNTIRVRADVLAQALCCDEGFLVKKMPAMDEIDNGKLYFYVNEALFNTLHIVHKQQETFHMLVERKIELKKIQAKYRN